MLMDLGLPSCNTIMLNAKTIFVRKNAVKTGTPHSTANIRMCAIDEFLMTWSHSLTK